MQRMLYFIGASIVYAVGISMYGTEIGLLILGGLLIVGAVLYKYLK